MPVNRSKITVLPAQYWRLNLIYFRFDFQGKCLSELSNPISHMYRNRKAFDGFEFYMDMPNM